MSAYAAVRKRQSMMRTKIREDTGFTIVLAFISLLLGIGGCDFVDPAHTKSAEDITTEEVFDPDAAWKEFEDQLRSNYAYLDRPGEAAVGVQLTHSRSLALSAQSKAEFRRVLHQTALSFGDPHLIVGPFDEKDYAIIYTGADLSIALQNGRFVVQDVRAASAADLAGVRPGWELVRADGIDIAEAALLPYGKVLLEPTDAQHAYGATLVANGRRHSNRVLTFRNEQVSLQTISLPSPYEHAASIAAGPSVTSERRGTNGEIGVLRFNNSLGKNEVILEVDELLSELLDCEALIIDLRNTPSGGNTDVARSIIGHFIDDWEPYQIHTIPAVEIKSSVPRRFTEYAAPRDPIFGGQVVVLHGRWTGSMGEGLVIGLDSAANAETIGSNMGDLLGALWNIDLKVSGARMDVGGEALFHVDGTPREDYIADQDLPTADRAPDGSDPAMRAALQFLGQL